MRRLLQTEDYARAILGARPDGNLDDLDDQVAERLFWLPVFAIMSDEKLASFGV